MSEYEADPSSEWGSWEDAERWRKRDFRNRTPAKRLDWLIAALELAYRSGAVKPRGPDESNPDQVMSNRT